MTREQLLTGEPVGVGFSAAVQLVGGKMYCFHPRDKSLWWVLDFDPKVPRWNAGKWGAIPIVPPRDSRAAALWEEGFNSKNRAETPEATRRLVDAAEYRAAYWSHRPLARVRRFGGLALYTIQYHTGRIGAVAWTWEGPGKYPPQDVFLRCREAAEEVVPPPSKEGWVAVTPEDDEILAEVFLSEDGGPMWVAVDRDTAVDYDLNRHLDWRPWPGKGDDRIATVVPGAHCTNVTVLPSPAWVKIERGCVISARATRGYDRYL